MILSREAVGKALPIIGLVAALGLFLPGLDNSWKVEPGNPEARERLRAGEFAYLTLALGLGGLASYATRTPAPFMLAATWSIAVISMHEIALHHRPIDKV